MGTRSLEAFVKEHGHCSVPRGYVTADGCQLGQWMQFQRCQPYSISAERKARLGALGFWEPQISAVLAIMSL